MWWKRTTTAGAICGIIAGWALCLFYLVVTRYFPQFGVTYAGIRARTTGAPQNHWFGPSGDPRAAGIGTPEAVITTWTGHREIIHDIGPIARDWKTPAAS